MTVSTGAQTAIYFETYITPLAQGRALSDAQINGIETDLYLRGSSVVSEFDITLANVDAASRSDTLGVYEYDEDGNISDVRVVAKSLGTVEDAIRVSDVDAGKGLGFFIIQDGYAALSNAVLDSNTLTLESAGGALRLSVSGRMLDDAKIFVSHDASLNLDGMEHVVSGLDAQGNVLRIGFETERRDGDASDDDFEDVVLDIDAILAIA